jgi:hypothetical protein
MKGKLIWSLVVGAVAGTMLSVVPAKADVLYVDNGFMPSSRIITSPVVIEDTTPSVVVDTTPVMTTTTAPVITTPIVVPEERSHFLNLGIGPLLDFGLF